MQKALQPLFYAREDTRSPLNYALVSMVVNAVVAIGLATQIGYMAAALATTLAGWVMMALLLRGARKLGDAAAFDAQFKRRFWRILLASGLMGAVLWCVSVLLGPFLAAPTIRYAALALLVGAGTGSYYAFGRLLGAFDLRDLRRKA